MCSCFNCDLPHKVRYAILLRVTSISAEKVLHFRTFWTWDFGIMGRSKADFTFGSMQGRSWGTGGGYG